MYRMASIRFFSMNIEIGFQKRINLIFSLLNEGDNIVFSPLRSENLFNRGKLLVHI
jgi:hypothetical protein